MVSKQPFDDIYIDFCGPLPVTKGKKYIFQAVEFLLAEAADAVLLPRSVVTLNDAGDIGIRAVDKDNKVVFFPIDLLDDTTNGLVLGGIPADARVIVAGQDLVIDGDEVIAVEADAATIKRLIGEATSGTL